MRAFLLFLILILPLQLSWAVMGSYCQSEQQGAPAHPGHHEHAAASLVKAGSDAAKGGDADGSCSSCQLSCMKSVRWSCLPMAVQTSIVLAVFGSDDHHPTSHIADGPEKPNWLLAA